MGAVNDNLSDVTEADMLTDNVRFRSFIYLITYSHSLLEVLETGNQMLPKQMLPADFSKLGNNWETVQHTTQQNTCYNKGLLIF